MHFFFLKGLLITQRANILFSNTVDTYAYITFKICGLPWQESTWEGFFQMLLSQADELTPCAELLHLPGTYKGDKMRLHVCLS